MRTAGRFIWEFFEPGHAEGAGRAFDAVYSLTRCEHERYAELGVDSTLVRWGIHPELLDGSASPIARVSRCASTSPAG